MVAKVLIIQILAKAESNSTSNVSGISRKQHLLPSKFILFGAARAALKHIVGGENTCSTPNKHESELSTYELKAIWLLCERVCTRDTNITEYQSLCDITKRLKSH